jgi:phytoene dehydrogenase-like protein
MMMRRGATGSYDAVIIGGGIDGLIAAAYLARSKARVLLLEASDRFGGRAETIEFAEGFRAPLMSHVAYALDTRVVRELRLADHGLDFAQSNMKLVALRPGGKHIVLPGPGLRGSAALAAEPGADGSDYATFRQKALRFACLLRPLWDGTLADLRIENRDDAVATIVRRLQLGPRKSDGLEILLRLSAAAFLDRWLESDALKAALSLDVFPSGLSPHEAGSALVLIWRYAQESCGRQGAVSQIRGGPGALARALEAAARQAGAELRASARVSSIIVDRRRATGVVLAGGETIPAAAVLSCLNSRETLIDLVEPVSIGFGTAASVRPPEKLATVQIMLALTGPPPLAGLEPEDLNARLVIALRPEIASEAKSAALNGGFSSELVAEVTIPTAADPALAPPGCHVVSLLIPYMPATVAGGWDVPRTVLHRQVLALLEGFAPGMRNRLLAHRVVTPGDEILNGSMPASASSMTRLLASYEARIRTPIAGLYFCGSSAEPVSAICGRAGRLAANLAVMGDHRTCALL